MHQPCLIKMWAQVQQAACAEALAKQDTVNASLTTLLETQVRAQHQTGCVCEHML